MSAAHFFTSSLSSPTLPAHKGQARGTRKCPHLTPSLPSPGPPSSSPCWGVLPMYMGENFEVHLCKANLAQEILQDRPTTGLNYLLRMLLRKVPIWAPPIFLPPACRRQHSQLIKVKLPSPSDPLKKWCAPEKWRIA